MKHKHKKTIQIILIIILLTITVFNLTYNHSNTNSETSEMEPTSLFEEILTKITPNFNILQKFSMTNIDKHKSKKIELALEIERNNNNINMESESYNGLLAPEKQKEKELNIELSKINKDKLKFHIPSMLISFEQEALNNETEITIHYSKIFDNSNIGIIDEPIDMIEEPLEEENTNEEANTNEEDITIEDLNDEIEELNQTFEDLESLLYDSHSVDELINRYKRNQSPMSSNLNLSISTIPINLKGDYEGIRGFIKYIDEMEYVENEMFSLESSVDDEGNQIIDAILLVNIYYGGGF